MKGAMQGKPKKGSTKAAPVDEAEPASAEVSLRGAREALGISVDEVAHDLHLSREVVLALEAADYDSLGAPVFVRGHLRSYARLLEIPEDEILGQYQTSEPPPEEFRTLSTPSVVKSGASLSGFVLWVMLGIVVLVAAVYLLIDPDDGLAVDSTVRDFKETAVVDSVPSIPAADRSASNGDSGAELDVVTDNTVEEVGSMPVPVALNPVVSDTDDPESTETVSAETAGEQEQTDLVQVAERVVDAPPAPASESPKVSLALSFSEECWVEVADAKRRLLYGLEKPGAVVELEGVPPFKIFFGNAPGVRMELAGNPYVVPRSLRGGNTARFTIEKDEIR
jgi:cytoskeleton protein RodZ